MKPVLPSAAMLARAGRRLIPVCLLAAIGCRPEAPTRQPEPAADPVAEAGGPTTAIDAGNEVEEDPAPSELDGDTDSEPAPEVSEIDPAPGPAEADPIAVAETKPREPLPKPIHKPGDGKCLKKFAVGEKVKNFKLPSLAGDKTISPAGYRNRVVLLNFWATWCKPCLEELPEFDRLYRKYRSHGMTLVAVTTDEDPKPVQAFVDEHKLVAKIALKGDAAASAYDRPQFPFSFVVDGDGTIVAAFDFVNDSCLGDLEQVIRASLEQLD